MNEWQKIRFRHGIVAACIATVVALIGAIGIFFASTSYFVWRYPHDAMDGLGGISLGLPSGVVIWVLMFDRGMKYQHRRAWEKQEAARLRR